MMRWTHKGRLWSCGKGVIKKEIIQDQGENHALFYAYGLDGALLHKTHSLLKAKETIEDQEDADDQTDFH